MKSFIRYIFYFLIIILSFSCENYLDTESNSIFTEKTAFKNIDFAEKAVLGIYNSLTTGEMWDYNLVYFRSDSDIEHNLGVNNDGLAGVAHYTATEGNSVTANVWNAMYRAIEMANICIDNLPISTVWTGEYAKKAHQLYGEAVTLRAYLYWELINIWGDVPFLINSTQGDDNLYLQKTDRDSIYEYLIAELEEIEPYVPWIQEMQTTERVNKGFVKGLRARMSLSYAGYSLRNKTFETKKGRYWEEYLRIANQECKEIIESEKHQLNPNFENIFRRLHSYEKDLTYNECMFEIPFLRLYSGRFGHIVGMKHALPDTKYGRSMTAIYTNPVLYYKFDKNDQRRNVSCELYNYAQTNSLGKQALIGYQNWELHKWRKMWINPSMGGDLSEVYFTGINFPLMRYSDIILMYAETENEINGPNNDAQDALSKVRKRAFKEETWSLTVNHYVDSVSVSKESFFNAIVDERAFEFVGEFYRKYDLVRWNLLGQKVTEMKSEFEKIINNHPDYSFVPTHIYWRNPDNGEQIEILNPDYRLPNTTYSGYSKKAWLPSFNANQKTSNIDVFSRVANGYDQTKNNHLMPLSSNTISASKGTLANDQIP